MKFLHKATLLFLVFLCLAPFTAMAAETGEEAQGDITTVHNEYCFAPGTSSFDTNFVQTEVHLEEPSEVIGLEFKGELLNVTQGNTTLTDFTGFTISWEYFTDASNITQGSGDHVEAHIEDVSETATVFWSLSLTDDSGDEITSFCVDGSFQIETEHQEEHHEEEEDNLLGNLAVSLLIVLAVPGIMMVAFNKFT